MEELVNGLLPLAVKPAREFDNIPGLPFAEIELAAQEALIRNPKDRFPDAGKLLAAISKPRS